VARREWSRSLVRAGGFERTFRAIVFRVFGRAVGFWTSFRAFRGFCLARLETSTTAISGCGEFEDAPAI
jgi:hypothetical protein